ncbi:hypothetical protein KMW28_13720 [Flammeovirga yaeyamensis]|uniref:Uncharacterized protein n=1 Tax=Flammeovirga yaeyamensis TaxID=367791 RepID=A0AAX1N3H6_9BACT|nr:hypothetical protein [Flammeovirga yaeyamensis]MBB3700954.1 hypothetical protein [Flammeovirga yaeyamensis]NMF38060.1 hypothetical protein [Flammeovirga yaeyamensis]QWG00710.1 hypothetical protein KMW28_13720 [Flammeovirga yaeyamensis]
MPLETDKSALFARVLSTSCTTQEDTQKTYDGIHQEYIYHNSSSVLKEISSEKKRTRFESRTSELNEKRNQLTYVENELTTMDTSHSKYKEKVVEKNKLVADISELELKLEQNDGMEVYFQEIDNIMLDTETTLLHELLHQIKDHAATNAWTLNDHQIKELEVVV